MDTPSSLTTRRPYSWLNHKLEVRDTSKHGKGVFAKHEIEKDEVLIVMGGYVLTVEDDNLLTGPLADKPIEISECFSIGPRSESDLDLMPQVYVNHSCDPNAGFKGQIFMVAMRRIFPEEEITYDYAMVMHPHPESNSYFRMRCTCGSPRCRGLVTEHDWEIPELQNRYDGYFQQYLQEKIRNKKGDQARDSTPPIRYDMLPPPWAKKNRWKMKQQTRSWSWTNPTLRIKDTMTERGVGVFASTSISKGTVLAVFGGKIISTREEAELPPGLSDYGIQVSEELVLTPRTLPEDPPDTPFNHSCDPNAGFKGQIFLVAMRDIVPQEEVTFDYGMVLHQTDNGPRYNLKCFCGSRYCRHFVTDNDWKLPKLQEKYDGFFQWYLQEKIKRLA